MHEPCLEIHFEQAYVFSTIHHHVKFLLLPHKAYAGCYFRVHLSKTEDKTSELKVMSS